MLSQNDRATIKQQRPCALWFTGVSGAGKSTIAALVEKKLFSLGAHTYLLDGDILRQGLCSDLGFSVQDRNENIRRIGATAKVLTDAGLMVLTATISPFADRRADVRAHFAKGEFIEIFVDAPLAVCEARDTKGLYRKARAGEIIHFTGIDSAYEAPQAPEIHLHTDQQSAEKCAQTVVNYLRDRQYLPR
jgi:adenylylsulfate kinase